MDPARREAARRALESALIQQRAWAAVLGAAGAF
jgi:hypothetical protein